MKIRLMIAALSMVTLPVCAQETYENANIATEDLNGTARYVGMGGAMDALGADISTMRSNPAGMGLFRRSAANVTFGLVSQQDASNFADGRVTNFSFDQVGFVWSNQVSSTDFVNFGFSYHKSRNFNHILSVVHALDNASQNKATAIKNDNGVLYDTKGEQGLPDFDHSYSSCTILDDLYARNLNYNATDKKWYFYNGEEYDFKRSQTGYIAEYDFNLSGNVNNTFYWGVTIGLHDVNYSRYTRYGENLIGGLGGVPGEYGVTIEEDRDISGTGFDVKVGAIFRPIEESPLRFGISIATPTWYNLRTTSYTTFNDNTKVSDATSDEYKFKLYTPWKFGLSAGHTFDNLLAIGLGYEYTDYSALDSRNLRDGYYGEYDNSDSDKEMNRHTAETLRGVSTIKAGVELKPAPELAIRLGYNYVSPMYKKDGFKDSWIESMGSYHSSTTDFTNWESTHRITCGIGYQMDSWNIGLAYQYSVQNGYFAPFDSWYDNESASHDNIADMVKVSNKRNHFQLTIGYTF